LLQHTAVDSCQQSLSGSGIQLSSTNIEPTAPEAVALHTSAAPTAAFIVLKTATPPAALFYWQQRTTPIVGCSTQLQLAFNAMLTMASLITQYLKHNNFEIHQHQPTMADHDYTDNTCSYISASSSTCLAVSFGLHNNTQQPVSYSASNSPMADHSIASVVAHSDHKTLSVQLQHSLVSGGAVTTYNIAAVLQEALPMLANTTSPNRLTRLPDTTILHRPRRRLQIRYFNKYSHRYFLNMSGTIIVLYEQSRNRYQQSLNKVKVPASEQPLNYISQALSLHLY
jgi:hypothetical protein